MKDQLPNLRLLGLESSEWGRDWDVLVQDIDQQIEDYGFELASQDIYLEFSHWPEFPKVMIYRSVVGPLKEIKQPFSLKDWESIAIERFELKSDSWLELFEEIAEIRKKTSLRSDFVIVLTRHLAGELSFNKQVLFR